ncbi:Uncharacterized conserved protein PhnB, glyoxalase superfamily [Lentzea fradiae]|uniref:Uncharacterized conserved protein PhnB, glyoxalase superfamily n=1 Tax=Lentzea fradiae TaxID=200378 RepID=A0A1G8DLA3_9PSEU|nr:VOC family protein [Lentzea fradiae]SDH58351.1 Uncharacterized conserved protein PhnB, glyoxalase superfamily [Lentzea fradiae]
MKLSHTFLFVRDQDEALKFYRDVIGLEVRTDGPIDDYRWLTVGPPDQPEVEIGLNLTSTPPVPPTDTETLNALLAKGSLQGLIFVADDVDAKFEQVQAAGAEVLQEPVDQFYGVRDCAFRDPSGNMIRFSSPR